MSLALSIKKGKGSQTALGRLPVREEPQHTHTHAGPTLLARPHSAGCQSGRSRNTHTHMRDQPCWPDRTRQVASQGGAATHTHAGPTLLARPHSAGRRSGRSRNTHMRDQPCRPDRTRQSLVREELQHICMWPILLMRPHSKCVYSTSSPLWMQSLSKHYKMPQVYCILKL